MDPALLAAIRGGTTLRKTITVDKSRPYFGGQKQQPAGGMFGGFPIPLRTPKTAPPPPIAQKAAPAPK